MTSKKVAHSGATYDQFAERVYADVRQFCAGAATGGRPSPGIERYSGGSS
jgi:hypothetical protein